jgi:uncharacterized membrane protein YdjX (TVP38/TMEM64 family)
MTADAPVSDPAPARRPGLWRPAALLGGVMVVLVTARLLGVGEHLGAVRVWIDGLGAWGPVAFLGLYVVGVVAALPGSAITIAAGALFGSALGLVLVSIGSTVGASVSFIIARYFARDAVERWLADNEKFRRLDELAERHGALIVALTRLVPLFPFNLLNYGFGLTRISFPTYVFWSWLCMLPGSALFVLGADALAAGISEGRVPWKLLGLIAALLLVTVLLARHARRRLRDRPETAPGRP